MKQDRLRIISAKDLGRLNMPNFCPRCFWIERHIDKPPSIFPGIFSTLDAVTKRSVHRSFLERGRQPEWLPLENIAGVEERDIYFKMPVEYGDWILIGRPDDIFKEEGGGYHIVDYKTAKFTARQDELYPLYEVQLNAYAFLAEKYGFKPINKLSLVYCQPKEDLNSDDSFDLGFTTHVETVDLNTDIVPELLLRAREILDSEEPPEAAEDCQGICRWLDKANKAL